MNTTSPYITTVLYFPITLKPDQMNENIYNNMKESAMINYKSKCYKDYGYVVDIIKIIDKSEGICNINNTESGINFNITASVILCKPIRNSYILCQIISITKILILANNGPINIVVTPDRMSNKFSFQNNELKYKDENKMATITNNDIIKIRTEQVQLINNADKITVMGILEDMATEDEIKIYYDDYYKATNYLKLVQ